MYAILLSIALVGLAGCAAASLSKERPNGGHVQVVGPGSNTPDGVKKAEAIISKKCPNGWSEVERGTEPMGTTIGAGGGSAVPVEAFYIEFNCK